MVTAAVLIGMKDLRQRLRDRSALVLAIVAPLGLALILDATLGSAVETTRFDFAVVDEDGGELGQGFTALLGELEAQEVATIRVAADRAEAQSLVSDGEVNAAFIVPASFTDSVRAGQPSEVVVIGDRSAPISVSVAEAVATGFGHEVDAVNLAVASVVTEAPTGSDPAEVAAAAQALEAPIELAARPEEGRGFDTTSYYAISLSVFFLFFTVQFGVLSLLEERENGTLVRLQTSPNPAGAIIVGKLLSSFVLGVTSMAVMVVATTLLMGAEWGDPLGVAVFVLLGVLAGLAIAALVSAVAKTAEQAGAFASMVAVVLGLLGGVFFPLNEASDVMGTLSVISPHRWLLDGFRDVSYGVSLTELGTPMLAVAVFIVATGSVGLAAAARGVAQR